MAKESYLELGALRPMGSLGAPGRRAAQPMWAWLGFKSLSSSEVECDENLTTFIREAELRARARVLDQLLREDALLESSGAVLSGVPHCPTPSSRNRSTMTQQFRARRMIDRERQTCVAELQDLRRQLRAMESAANWQAHNDALEQDLRDGLCENMSFRSTKPSMDDEASSELLKTGALTRDPASRVIVTSSGAKRLFTTTHSIIKRGCGDVVVVGASKEFCLAAPRSPHPPTIVALPPSRRALKFNPVVLVAISDENRNDDGVHKHDTEWLPNKGRLSQVFGPSLERVKLECQRAGYPARYTQLMTGKVQKQMVCQEWEAALQHEEQREIKSGRRKADEQRHVSAIMGPGVSGAGDLSDDGQGVIAWIRGSFKKNGPTVMIENGGVMGATTDAATCESMIKQSENEQIGRRASTSLEKEAERRASASSTREAPVAVTFMDQLDDEVTDSRPTAFRLFSVDLEGSETYDIVLCEQACERMRVMGSRELAPPRLIKEYLQNRLCWSEGTRCIGQVMCADPYNPTSLDARLHAPERVLSFDVQGDGRVGFVEREDIVAREKARLQRIKALNCLPDDVVTEDVCSSLTSMWDAIEAAEKKGERPELSEEERGLEAGMFDYHNHVDKYPEAPPSGLIMQCLKGIAYALRCLVGPVLRLAARCFGRGSV